MPTAKEYLVKRSKEELDNVVKNFSDYESELLHALILELEERKYSEEVIPSIKSELEDRKKIANIAEKNNIKKSISFNWTPKHIITTKTKLPIELVKKNAVQAILSLQWSVVYFEELQIEAKRTNDYGKPTEKIIINISDEHITATSKSDNNRFCDFGSNSRRTTEFLTAFKALEASYDEEKIQKELAEIEVKKKENEYKIPDKLTKPPFIKEKKMPLLIGTGLLSAAVIAGILAVLANMMYIIFLYDIGVAWLTAFIIGSLIKVTGISNFNILRWFGFITIAITYLLSQIFRFFYIVQQHNIVDAQIMDYFNAKVNNGLQYKDMNLGSVGLVVAWIIELVVAGIYYQVFIAQKVLAHDLNAAPQDVIEYANHWFNKGKDEDGVRVELAKMGWKEKEQQDLVFSAIGAQVGVQEMNRE